MVAWILQIELAFGTTREKIAMIVKTSATTKIRSSSLRRFIELESTNEEIKFSTMRHGSLHLESWRHLVEMSMPCLSLFYGLQALGSRKQIGHGPNIYWGIARSHRELCCLLMTSGFLEGRKNMSELNIG